MTPLIDLINSIKFHYISFLTLQSASYLSRDFTYATNHHFHYQIHVHLNRLVIILTVSS